VPPLVYAIEPIGYIIGRLIKAMEAPTGSKSLTEFVTSVISFGYCPSLEECHPLSHVHPEEESRLNGVQS
jgi:hypothetical protein